MSQDELYLRDLLARIEAFYRAQEMKAAMHHASAQQERRKYMQDPEPITAFSQLEQK
jgi:hypothetical protein